MTDDSIVRPVWSDPRLIGSQNTFTVRNVVLAGAGPVLLAPNNPGRWAIGFFPSPITGSLSNVMFSPDPDPDTGGFQTEGIGIWLDLLHHGPIIQAEWYAKLIVDSTITVIEVFNL